ncbi:ComF family protein [Rhizobium sp. RU36D]|uniref:ComF family protein n=1 Tax=Rhizobium sp. RU36D TaxID=1907415 RepID=UPI001FCD82FC|nr:ComF family protein [Rhizobium sp. RU36D]
MGFGLRGLAGAGRLLRDLVYPPACAACGIGTHKSGGLCSACWGSVEFIERPYCEVLGLPFSHDLGPGILSPEAIANPPEFDRLRSVARHEGIARDLVHALKYRDRLDLAPMMATWMMRAGGEALRESDVVMPVPLHRWRLLSRKFNQSAELARHLARLAGKPYLPATLLRRKRTHQQVGLSATARQENVRGAFAIAEGREADVFGRRVVLVDDVYTTGATVAAATRVLKRAGASEVTVLTFARAL